MTIDQHIDRICERLPEYWSVRINLEQGYGGVIAVRPDGTEVYMNDSDDTIEEQLGNAFCLARDETDADKLSQK